MTETDRSRIIAYQACPRQRYLAYHAHGTGLQRKSKSLPLQFGAAFHEGTEVLLSHEGMPKSEGPYPGDQVPCIELAVGRAVEFLTTQFDAHAISFDGEYNTEEALAYGREEQMALAEALLRAWWAYEGVEFLERFEVIEVEREGRAQLAQMNPLGECHYDERGRPVEHYKDELVLMFRPDALVREKATGDLYVVSWKTCATFGKRNTDQARHDMQSMSEVWGVVAQWNQDPNEQPIVSDFMTSVSAHRRIEGVLYKFIVKGRRSLDKWDNLYKQNTHLVYGWMKRGDTPEEDEWSWAYEYEKEDGSGNSRLGKGWRKVPIWREYPGGVKAWIDDLHHQRVFPRHLNALTQIFPESMPVERRADEVEHWKAQVVAQETTIAQNVETIAQLERKPVWDDGAALGVIADRNEMLDVLFPQHTHSCHSYSGCPFLAICWEGAPAKPGDLYQIRVSNHPEKGDEE